MHEERQVRQITLHLECQVRTNSWTVELQSEILDSFAGMSFENNLNNGRWKRFLTGRMSGVESLKLRSQEFQPRKFKFMWENYILLLSNKDLNDINGQDYFPILEIKISLIINGQDYSSSMCVKSSVERRESIERLRV